MSSDVRRITYALLNAETSAAAAEALRGVAGREAVEGLVGLLSGPHNARAGVAAVAALRGRTEPGAVDGWAAALRSGHATVRQAAADALRGDVRAVLAGDLIRIVRSDDSWPVRRSAVVTLANWTDDTRWSILWAATDPHWRVRNELIQCLLRWGEDPDARGPIEERLRDPLPVESGPQTARRLGVLHFLLFRWRGIREAAASLPPVSPTRPQSPLADPDPAVVLREWQRLPRSGKKVSVHLCPGWLTSREPRLVAVAVDALREWGDTEALLETTALLDDPRAGAFEPVLRLLASLDAERTEVLARALLRGKAVPAAALAWSLDQFGAVFPLRPEEPELSALLRAYERLDAVVGTALVGLAGRWQVPEAAAALESIAADGPSPALRLASLSTRLEKGLAPNAQLLEALLQAPDNTDRAAAFALAVRSGIAGHPWAAAASDPAWEVRQAVAKQLVALGPAASTILEAFAADSDPRVRAASLTTDRSAKLVQHPEAESSWHVLARAASMARVPFWNLAPTDPWRPATKNEQEQAPLSVPEPTPTATRRLGPGAIHVFPMGISGHYGLPVEGFVRAADAGVNLFFWEPDYRSLGEFMRRLPSARRIDFHLVAGTFEAEPGRIRKDLERALRMLGVERLSFFMLFWVQTWARASSDVRAELERMQAQGLMGAYGLSTHSRTMAVEAIDAGWNPVMVRHSAAHPGAEVAVLPRAREMGTSILTFSNTCYGRLLRAGGGQPGARAGDCYRYTLNQPAVSACFSAPATLEQLEENLSAVREPDLPEDRRKTLLARGKALHEEESLFRQWVRAR